MTIIFGSLHLFVQCSLAHTLQQGVSKSEEVTFSCRNDRLNDVHAYVLICVVTTLTKVL